MPYIARADRPEIDRMSNPVIARIAELPRSEALIHLIGRILRDAYPPRYRHINAGLGVLDAVGREYCRMMGQPDGKAEPLTTDLTEEIQRQLDEVAAPLVQHFKDALETDRDGELNYAITRMFLSLYGSTPREITEILCVLERVADQYYSEVVGPYEDRKIQENGVIVPLKLE